MLVRFVNIQGCTVCTQTIDFSKLRSIGLLNDTVDVGKYLIRLSFDNGDTLVVYSNKTYEQAVALRSTLESYWLYDNNATSITVAD